MRNSYRAEGNTVYIEVISKGKSYDVLIDKEDAKKFSELDRKICISPNKTGHYASFYMNNKKINLHRWIMGNPEGLQVDHINSDGLDNRQCNLRVVTNKQNAMNLNNKYAVGVSGYKGVITYPPTGRQKRYQVKIRRKSYGYYATPEEANKVAQEVYNKIREEQIS